jgi:hypothetical protein
MGGTVTVGDVRTMTSIGASPQVHHAADLRVRAQAGVIVRTPRSWVCLRAVQSSLEGETGDATEDAVVGDERYTEMQCGGCDPAVGVVTPLGKCMAASFTGHPYIDVGVEQLGTGPDHLGAREAFDHTGDPFGPPVAATSAEADLCDGLKRDDKASSSQERPVQVRQRPGGAQEVSAEDVGVDYNRRRSGTHASAGDGFEEGGLFLVAEIVEHRLFDRYPRLGARQLLLDG